MALFTDVAVISLDDLLPFEASLVQVSASHGIDVESKINLALSAIGDRLFLRLLNVGAADPQSPNRKILGLSTIVMTPPLRRWACFESLARVFAEAYNVQLNTRFEGKWKEYMLESKTAAELFFRTGAGVVHKALPKAATPLVSVQTGTLVSQVLSVQTAWVGASGDEGALSPVNAINLPNASSMAVAMAEGALAAPEAAVGWNVYAGASDGTVSRQNAQPLAIGSTWDMPLSGLVIGPSAVNGQAPDAFIPLATQIKRG